ncbi:PF04187 family protein [Leptospira broomii serovar Hurstbridge str. 5399]|uniref:PF04187 family protein n=1 Tax=Leptospira broomii serovar Hurstbridge str. 5399 TaxID=1049789 RepID=T0GBX6_9LEPT|nr:ChaN family lipoprotein [Leptospira broomii]EQA44324.1 PF04187 family protein [Leptospira broomii serovar Hurstbridge str. 5399]
MLFRKVLLIFMMPLGLASQSDGLVSEKIFDSKSQTLVSRTNVESKVREADVIIIGEEHDDAAGHEWQLSTFKKLSESFALTLSLEMLERDQQIIVDEYLKEGLTEKGYLNHTKFWPNYAKDYHPIVEAAKIRNIPVLASNAPRRYVNLVSQKGIQSLMKIRSPFLPPRYLLRLHRQVEYEAKLTQAMGGHHSEGSTSNIQNFIDAQYLWDASMADAIAEEFYTTGRKIVHINGRFHSDQGMGVTYRLRQMGLKVLVFSVFPLEEGRKLGREEFELADFLVITTRKSLP